MRAVPLANRVILKVGQNKEKMYGSIIIPESVQKDKPEIAEILAIGDEVKESYGLVVGATVIFARYGGSAIELEGESILVISENDLLARID